MIIHSNVPTRKVELPKSVLDMVSERSCRAMYKANRNESHISSDESSIRAISNELPNMNGDISTNSDGVFDLADTICELSDALFDLADYVAELEEMIINLTESEEE